MRKFFSEFKTFITRGNVIDMAVGVIVGSAFTAIVTALTKQVFQPLVNWALAGTGNGLDSAVTMLKEVRDETGAVDMANSIYIDWGAFITAIINFLIVAFILFAIVRTINKVRDAANSRFYGFEKSEYLKMRIQGLSKKDIELLARKRDEEAKAKAEQEKAEQEKAETQDDILKDIRELLRGMTLTSNGGKASEEGKPEGE